MNAKWAKILLMFFLLTNENGLGATNGNGVEKIIAKQESRLEEAMTRLKKQRKEIHEAQVPLAKKLNHLQQKNDSIEEILRSKRQANDLLNLDFEGLEDELEARRQTFEGLVTSMEEFVSGFYSSLSPAETNTYGEAIVKHNLLKEEDHADQWERFEDSLKMLSLAADRLEGMLGGKQFFGEALNARGIFVEGRFFQIGPLLYFASEDQIEAGWIEETESLHPQMRAMEAEATEWIWEYASGKGAHLPVSALAEAPLENAESLGEHLQKGGIWVYPILFFALVATAISLVKFWQIFFIRQPQTGILHKLIQCLRNGDSKTALKIASLQPQPAAEMLMAGVKHSGESIELMEEVMYESMLATQPRLERFLNVIALTAATAPLLGLLGTVSGIIKTFERMELFGTGDPKPLIAGISEALITTELGLILAIPALISHALLSRRVAGILAEMEKLSLAMINGLSHRSISSN